MEFDYVFYGSYFYHIVLCTLHITYYLALSLLIDIHITVMRSRQRHGGSPYSHIRNTVQDGRGTKFISCISGLLSSFWGAKAHLCLVSLFLYEHCVFSWCVYCLSVLSTQTHHQLRLKMHCLQPVKAQMGREAKWETCIA